MASSELNKILENYVTIINAILTDNVFCEDTLTEIHAANANLCNDISSIDSVTEPAGFLTFEDLLKALTLSKQQDENFDEADLIELIDSDTILNAATDIEGYKIIKVESLADQIKLDEFIQREIYPYNISKVSV